MIGAAMWATTPFASEWQPGAFFGTWFLIVGAILDGLTGQAKPRQSKGGKRKW
jgi:hypothetical protein